MENFKSVIRLNKINKNLLNKNILVVGWVKKIRKLGEKIFLDLMDGEFILQVIFENKDLFDFKIKNQFLLLIEGDLIQRKSINSKLINGDLELKANRVKIISSSKELPFIIEKETDALEQQRMKYRYLDLRRENINRIFKFRSKLNHIIRNFMFQNDFIEVETPAITLPTIGGSGQITTSSSVGQDYYYSLSQSPQIYKQLLMIGQLNRYYQIAKCFRDEKARSDRQMEFSQLDIEMSFVNSDDIKKLIESLINEIFEQMLGISNLTFKQISYNEAIQKYGTDKPDLRFDNQIEDISHLFKNYEHDFIKIPLAKSKLRLIKFPLLFSNSELKKIALEAKSQNAIVFWVVKNKDKITSSIKDLPNQINDFFTLEKETIFLSFDLKEIPSFLGWLRNKIANDNKELFNISDNNFNFLWVNNFPMFEIEDGKISSSHNPFTSPLKDDFFKLEKPNYLAESKSYDLVLNGVEIAGGSERISNYEDQKKVFELLGMSEEEIEKYFGFFLEALKYGTPPHGGIAIGIDRLISIMLNLDSIREVIAFPKTSHGRDEMTKGPFKNEK